MTANHGVNTDLGDPYCVANFNQTLPNGQPALPLRPGALGGGSGSGSGSGPASGDAGASDAGASDAGGGGGGPQACAWSAKPDGSGTGCAAGESCAAPTGGYCTKGTAKCTCQPKVCSGLEGVTTTAPGNLVPADHPTWAANMLGAAGTSVNAINSLTGAPIASCKSDEVQAHNPLCATNGLSVGMKPGTWYALFCADADGLNAGGYPKGYNNCIGGVTNPFNPYTGYYFDTMLQAVANSFGHYPNATPGPLSVPDELANRRFYFQEWMLALVKYLQTADVPNASIEAIDANPADPDEFYFDPINGSFESANYIFRGNVNSNNQAPTQLNIATNLQTSVINNYAFSRHNYRGETALYTALKESSTDQLGAEPLFIQNMVGSLPLQLLYGAYACAVDASASGCNPSQVPPVDPITGKSIYVPYADSFGNSSFTIPGAGGAPNNSGMTVDSSSYELIQSALVTVPIFSSPYNIAGQKPKGQIQELLPYLAGEGVGFEITIDGSRDKFYPTQNIDFSGATISASVDFEYVTEKASDGTMSTSTTIRAIETGNYLGLVFPCIEQSPTVPGTYDILAVRMYDNSDSVISWINAHPGSVSDCGIQIKYSIYGNYADYITFGVYPGYPISGTRFGLNAGYGGSVIADVTTLRPQRRRLAGPVTAFQESPSL